MFEYPSRRNRNITYIDVEIDIVDHRIHDLGAIRENGAIFHSNNIYRFVDFLRGSKFLCGHNIVEHDLKYLRPYLAGKVEALPIDTLCLSPLFLPTLTKHQLHKNYKLRSAETSNPVCDARLAKDLLAEEIATFLKLPLRLRRIFTLLLYDDEKFRGFFRYLNYKPLPPVEPAIRMTFKGSICDNAPLTEFIEQSPVALAYALAQINADSLYVSPYVQHNYPEVENILMALCNTPSFDVCHNSRQKFDIDENLRHIFGYTQFRTYGGKTLQRDAVAAAVDGKSLLAVFPTGGGKSLTFQLPALMAGKNVRGLTVVISPLQALMKDQVDNLHKSGIVGAVTLNGMQNLLERREALEQLANGSASLLYISPEQLRSRTIEHHLQLRNVVRFVIDEAHCFSAWGHDFRVDYMYIAKFIGKLQRQKSNAHIPVSCFTATAKPQVITDIDDYFRRELRITLEHFTTTVSRNNLHYSAVYCESKNDKYNTLRSLLEADDCPTIVYVSYTAETVKLAQKLTSDGFPAKPFHGKLAMDEKVANQEAFISGETNIIVATSAFGMGIDKRDIGRVVHYDIPDSLENYVQESGRAGRDASLQANCCILFDKDDLDKHFMLLNRTKLNFNEVRQIWIAVKKLTTRQNRIRCSALEIARQAGWPDSETLENKVGAAIAALENSGYLERENNMPQIYATAIHARTMDEVSQRINRSHVVPDDKKETATRIMQMLISQRSRANAGTCEAESRVDYIADKLALEKRVVIDCVNLMRQINLLNNDRDMTAFICENDKERNSLKILRQFSTLEQFLISQFKSDECEFMLKKLNEAALYAGCRKSSVKNIRTILYYFIIKNYVRKVDENAENQYVKIRLLLPSQKIGQLCDRKFKICQFIINTLYAKLRRNTMRRPDTSVGFSVVGLFNEYKNRASFDFDTDEIELHDIENALLYLTKIGAMQIDGGFMVLYNRLEIKRLQLGSRIQYKLEDYRKLRDFYRSRVEQIHIMGEYADMMIRDPSAAEQYVMDYFQLDFKSFLSKYFKGDRLKQIQRNITTTRYNLLFGGLSERQLQIINDDVSQYIVVAAGPGSGKTKILVHKLAALLLLEDVKSEQILMLTFSRAAASEFKQRLKELIQGAANHVEIRTFHSYCFNLLGRMGNPEEMENVVAQAVADIQSGEIEQSHIAKSILVIDEAQDMSEDEYNLVKALIKANNENMRVIAVGDDDQNIYAFRGSDSKYLKSFITEFHAKTYEMVVNYRSCRQVVDFANAFVKLIRYRMKVSAIRSNSDVQGHVSVVRHLGSDFETPVVDDILHTYESGSRACVLTYTNNEAFIMLGLLQKKGIPAKLIQSCDGFRLYNLAEVRFFLKFIKPSSCMQDEIPANVSPIIDEALWNEAKIRLRKQYADSECLDNCMKMIETFEAENEKKYFTDFEEFIRESKYEDFYESSSNPVFVSTIHKSKGREFDSVYMLLDGFVCDDDKSRRLLYVGMTRAKRNLYIHCNESLCVDFSRMNVDYSEDYTQYAVPDELAIQLTHRHVYLDFFKDKKNVILRLQSGRRLLVNGDFLNALVGDEEKPVVKFSAAFVDILDEYWRRGYVATHAKVNFIVAWKSKSDKQETAVLLPVVYLKKVGCGG